jgi:predicted RNA-binding Zn ribbon-like protein
MVNVNMNTYEQRMAQAVEDLINTFDTFLDQPEHLQTPQDLDRFLSARGIDAADASERDLDAVKALRETLRDLWTSDDLSALQDGLNRLIAGQNMRVEYALKDGALETRIQAAEGAALADQMAAAAAVGLSWAIRTHGVDRMRACIAAPCKDVFIDTSKNATRRFCSERCANRHNVAQYRARRQNLTP